MAFEWLKSFFSGSKPDKDAGSLSEFEDPSDEATQEIPPEPDPIVEKLDLVSSDLRKLLKRGRRQQQLLELMYEEHGKRLGSISRIVQGTLPCDRIFEFVEVFGVYALAQESVTPELEHAWKKLQAMLDGLEMEMIVDAGQPFDPVRHAACDTRWDDRHPEGIVLQVVRPGLMVQGEIYKTAVVVVNKQPQGVS